MAEFPRVSYVVPSFKAAETLPRTLDSLLGQNYPDMQIIVVDGGSKDGTVQILEQYSNRLDHWVSEPDEGQVDALNKGFRKANGQLWGWLCADDELTEGAVHRLVKAFQEDPGADVVTGGCIRDFNGEHRVKTEPDPRFLDKLDHMNTIEQPSTLWRALAHKAAGELDGSYRYAFDWEFWCRMKRVGARYVSIPDPISIYYFSDSNLTSTGGRKITDEMYRIVKNYGPRGGEIADVYMWLYKNFDLNGFYDAENADALPAWKRAIHHAVLKALYGLYGEELVNSYNWNFASRQERGLGW